MTRKLWYWAGRVAAILLIPITQLILYGSQRTRPLVISRDKILVVHGWLSDGRWSLPGGGMRRHESVAECTAREVLEEVGLIIDPAKVKSLASEPAPGRHDHFTAVYVLVELAKASQLKVRWPEIFDAAWLPISQINSVNAEPCVLRALALVGQTGRNLLQL